MRIDGYHWDDRHGIMVRVPEYDTSPESRECYQEDTMPEPPEGWAAYFEKGRRERYRKANEKFARIVERHLLEDRETDTDEEKHYRTYTPSIPEDAPMEGDE